MARSRRKIVRKLSQIFGTTLHLFSNLFLIMDSFNPNSCNLESKALKGYILILFNYSQPNEH